MPPSATPYLRSDAADLRSQDKRQAGADLDNIFRLARGEKVGSAAQPEPRRVTQPDLDAALDMLNRAARAMDLLQSRYVEVESYARDVAERAEKDLSAAHGDARTWETRAVAGESLAEDLQRRLAAAERRASHAEHRADVAERRAAEAERVAGESRDWLENFYEKIVAAFEARPAVRSAAA